MNILIVPFHDWRKILLEGFRTRDSHFIEELNKNKNNIKVVINRPTTFVEIFLKRKKNLIKGKIIFSKPNFRLYELEENLYLIDYISPNFFGQIANTYKWFVKAYGHEKYISFVNDAINYLGIQDNFILLNQNIFAYKLTEKLNPKISVFDAWDNFMKFNVYHNILSEIKKGYQSYSKKADFWITNSKDNVIDFEQDYMPRQINLITNGLDITRFVAEKKSSTPKDMIKIKRPIVGFGGKITQLIDVDLLNDTMKLSPQKSFVFVGQILDKNIYDKIDKLDNFYYLGDKHYNEYPNYVKNFDICIVPYVVSKEKKSGANSIKVYEYLATGKKVVGTASNGLEDLKDHVYIVKNGQEFALALNETLNNKTLIDVNTHSWKKKIEQFTILLNEH